MRIVVGAWIVFAAIGLSVSGGLGAAIADPGPSPSDQPNVTVRIPGNGHGRGSGGSGGTPSPSPSNASAPPVAPTPTSNADQLSLDHKRVRVGEVVTATGRSFTAGERVQFVAYPERTVLGSFTTGANGTVVAAITVPKQLSTGDHTIEATGWASHHVANAPVTIVSGGSGSSGSTPWIVWSIVSGGLLCGIAAFFVAISNGWLPFLLVARSVA